ncbi:hypothetical protein SLS61_009461 [Didymella pomorum]
MPAVPELLNAIAQLGSVAPRDPALTIAAMTQEGARTAPMAAPIAKRQQMVIQQGIIPTYYNLSGPEPGTVVGIVLGSVAGFLLIVWLLFTLTQGNKAEEEFAWAEE